MPTTPSRLSPLSIGTVRVVRTASIFLTRTYIPDRPTHRECGPCDVQARHDRKRCIGRDGLDFALYMPSAPPERYMPPPSVGTRHRSAKRTVGRPHTA